MNKLFNLTIVLENIDFKESVHNCRIENLDNIYKELYKRFIIPFYIPILILISLLLIIKSKENVNYLRYRILIFIIGVNAIIFSEITLKFIQSVFMKNIYIMFLPILIFGLLYSFFVKKYKIDLKYKFN